MMRKRVSNLQLLGMPVREGILLKRLRCSSVVVPAPRLRYALSFQETAPSFVLFVSPSGITRSDASFFARVTSHASATGLSRESSHVRSICGVVLEDAVFFDLCGRLLSIRVSRSPPTTELPKMAFGLRLTSRVSMFLNFRRPASSCLPRLIDCLAWASWIVSSCLRAFICATCFL